MSPFSLPECRHVIQPTENPVTLILSEPCFVAGAALQARLNTIALFLLPNAMQLQRAALICRRREVLGT